MLINLYFWTKKNEKENMIIQNNYSDMFSNNNNNNKWDLFQAFNISYINSKSMDNE